MDEQVNQENSKQNTDSSTLSRSAQLLKAASPYLDPASQQLLGTFVQMQDFMDTIQNIKRNGFSLPFMNRQSKSDTLFMTGLNSNGMSIDAEGLLKSIRPFCTKKEGGIIDQIMNIFHMKRMFSMYQNISNMMSMMNVANGASEAMNSEGDFSQAMNMAAMMSQMMNSSQSNQNNENTTKSASFDASDINFNDFSTNHCHTNDSFDTYTNISSTDSQNDQYSSDNSYLNNDYLDNDYLNNDESGNDYSNDNYTNHSNTNNTNNAQMLEMLSSMIPAEQKGTFEAMKLLMESGILK